MSSLVAPALFGANFVVVEVLGGSAPKMSQQQGGRGRVGQGVRSGRGETKKSEPEVRSS